MHSLPILADLPPGYFVEESPRGILALHVDVAQGFHRVGFGPDTEGPVEVSDLAGRRPLDQFEVDGERFLIRRFSHGGLLRWATGERYFDAERPFRELRLAHGLRAVGIHTPQVVAARARMHRGGGWRLDLVSRRLEGSVDLGHVLERIRRGDLPRERLRTLLPSLGKCVRRMHRHGVVHGDLTPRNMLVLEKELDRERPDIWVLDLDGTEVCEVLGEGRRLGNLRRLYRHMVRASIGGKELLTRSDYLRFLRAYEPERSRWKDDWRAIFRAHERKRAFHKLGWLLERRVGRIETLPDADTDLRPGA